MPAQAKCPKCDSVRWMSDLWILPPQTISVSAPNFLGTQPGSSEVQARACGNCGYVELYASSPRDLWRERRAREQAAERANRSNLPLPSDGGEHPRRDLPRPSSTEEAE
jgi:predicted nucleic-acid-binding Zn-ribbon protein